MIGSDQQRLELAKFLRTRRQHAHVPDFGIVAGRRRRTPGLRREEVAQLAQVSVTWYTFLEQGRPVRASADVLNRLARALRLEPAERDHLYLIARGHPPANAAVVKPAVDPKVQLMLDALPYPAYATTIDCTIAASNRAMRVAFLEHSALPGGPHNLLKLLFSDHTYRRGLVNWKQRARDTLAIFRLNTAHRVGESWHKKMIAELSAESPEFREWWSKQDVRAAHDGSEEFKHQEAGRMVFQSISMRYEGGLQLTITVKIPMETADTVRKMEKLMAPKPESSRGKRASKNSSA